MGLRKEPIICRCCGKEKKVPYSSVGIYCSNECQHQHQFDARFDAWVAGKEETSPRWLRKALVRKYGHICMGCELTDWMEQPIILELDHVDGNYENNSIKNLRLICPNCHSQTMTYKNRNKGKGRPNRRKR